MTRLVRSLLVLAWLLAVVVPSADAQQTPQEGRGGTWPPPGVVQHLLIERAIAHGAQVAEVLAVVKCETGGTWSPWLVGRLGEVGWGQWLPGRVLGANHWGRTPAWRELRIDIIALYRSGHPDALWIDADMLAWSFGLEAERLYPGNRRGWSCWWG